MFYIVLWSIVGLYFLYISYEILIKKKTDRIHSLKEHKFKNPDGFVLRYGLIELIMGLIIIATGIVIGILNNPILFTFMIGTQEINISSNYLMVALAILFILLILLNEKLSKKDEQ